jgi:hypothetical protein
LQSAVVARSWCGGRGISDTPVGYDTAIATEAPKRRISAEARRALLFDAALREFSAHGYDGASLGRIAADAGVTRTVLYDHFPPSERCSWRCWKQSAESFSRTCARL